MRRKVQRQEEAEHFKNEILKNKAPPKSEKENHYRGQIERGIDESDKAHGDPSSAAEPRSKAHRTEERIVFEMTVDIGGASSSNNAGPAASIPQRGYVVDDEDGANNSEPEWSDDETASGQVPGQEEFEDLQREHVRRRLRTKTAPASAPAYPQRALLKRMEYNIRKAKLKKAQLEQNNVYKAMRARAVELLSMQAEFPSSNDRAETSSTPHCHTLYTI